MGRGWHYGAGLCFATAGAVLGSGDARAAPNSAPTSVSARVLRDPGVHVAGSVDRGAVVVAELRRRRAALGLADELRLEAHARISASDPQLEIVTVLGRFGSAPLARPVARALVDLRDEAQIRLLTVGGPVPRVAGPPPGISAAEALGILDASGLPASTGAIDAELVASPRGNTTSLAWRIDPPLDNHRLYNPVFLVDAVSGSITVDHDQVQTADVVAFETNPVTTPSAARFSLVDIDPSVGVLSGAWFRVQGCPELPDAGAENCVARVTAVADFDGHFLYPAPDVSDPAANVQLDDPFAEVSLYYHADKFLEFLRGEGFPGLGCHVDGEVATLVANHKKWIDGEWVPVDNAYWTGSCERTMVFGQGAQVDFAYDGDVVYHELGHGVVSAQYGAWLGPRRRLDEALVVDPTALNEAFADFLSSSYTGDPFVADYVGTYWDRLEHDYIRNNANDFVCPDDLVGESHFDGEPFAALLWQAFDRHGPATIAAVLDTIALLPPQSPTLEEATATFEAVIEAALGDSAAGEVHADAVARGLVDCVRVTTPDTLRRAIYVRDPKGAVPFAPPPLQLRFDVPQAAASLELSFHLYTRGNQDGEGEDVFDATILARYGSAVTFEYTDEDDGTTTVDGDWELRLDEVDSGSASIPTRGTDSIFISFVNLGDETMNVDEITSEFPDAGGTSSSSSSTSSPPHTTAHTKTDSTPNTGDESGNDPPADGRAIPSHDDDGCGCTATPNRWFARAPWLMLGFIVVRRRRPRRPAPGR